MSAANNVLRIAELDFDTIKQNLKDYLRSQSQFQDFDFEGAGMNILLDILAKNTHYMAYYLNMVSNEMTLDSAQIFDEAISHAKHIGYTPQSRRAARAQVNIQVTPPPGNSTGVITMPAYTAFQSEAVDGVNYTFVTLEDRTATLNISSNSFIFSNVTIAEGEHLTDSFTVAQDAPTIPFVMTNANIDTSTLIVTVQQSIMNPTTNTYLQAEDLTEIGSNSAIYYVQAEQNGKYSLIFGDGYIGRALSNGNIIFADYIVTDGEVANFANTFTPMGPVYGFSNVIVTTTSQAASGQFAEQLETMRFRAPRFYVTQNRAVTKTDYNILLLKDYPNIQQVSVWGGEDNDPIVYGKVFISINPKPGFVLTNLEKQTIIEQLITNRNVLTVIPDIVDPDYTYLLLQLDVHYDPSLTTLTADGLSSVIRSSIVDYTENNLGLFGQSFRYSRLQTAIDNTDASINNNDMTVLLQKRFVPSLGNTANYTITYNTKLHHGGPTDKLYTYPPFTHLDTQGIVRTCFIEEVPFSFTGVQDIDTINPGFDYTEAQVVITGDGSGASAEATIVNGRIDSIKVITQGIDYTIADIQIIGDGQGATAQAVLSGRTGTLRMYYLKSDGEKIVINSDVGSIDYDAGIIKLFNFSPIQIQQNPYYANNIITFNIEAESQTIEPLRNQLVVLDSTDPLSIQITMTPET